MSRADDKLSQNALSAMMEAEIADALKKWWVSEIEREKTDPFAPKKTQGTLYATIVEIDSFSVVEALLVVEAIVGFEIHPNLIKRGGYRSYEEMTEHLIEGLRKSDQFVIKSSSRKDLHNAT